MFITFNPQNLLCQYHAFHVLRIPGSPVSSEGVFHLQGLIPEFLRDVITMQNPSLGHALITSLTVASSSSQYTANNETLQLIYIDCISECLEVLENLKLSQEGPENDSDSQYESDHTSSGGVRLTGSDCEKAMSMVYMLLSMVNGCPEMMRLTKKVETVFHTLLQASYPPVGGTSGDPISFDTGRIYGCLLGRSNTFLISRLQEVEEFLRLNRVPAEDPHAPLTTSPKPPRLPEVEEEVGVAYVGTPPTLSCREAAKAEWRNQFYDALFDHKHLLEAVLDRGLHFIYTGKLQELAWLMMKPEFIPLRPVLLLLGWDRYASMGSGRELLDVLWPMEVCVHVLKQCTYFSMFKTFQGCH